MASRCSIVDPESVRPRGRLAASFPPARDGARARRAHARKRPSGTVQNMALERPRRPTMQDVAKRAGVSLKTVSRVINGEPNVAGDLTSRVLAAATELGF